MLTVRVCDEKRGYDNVGHVFITAHRERERWTGASAATGLITISIVCEREREGIVLGERKREIGNNTQRISIRKRYTQLLITRQTQNRKRLY